jgi:hypothetical protein
MGTKLLVITFLYVCLFIFLGVVPSDADDWSWIDALQTADAPTKQRLKLCVLSMAGHLAALSSAAYEYEGVWEAWIPPLQGPTVNFSHTDCHGTARYLRGKLHNEITFDSPQKEEWKTSVLLTDKLLAFTYRHEVFGKFLQVNPPPLTTRDWVSQRHLLPCVDPKQLYGSFLGGGSAAVRAYVDLAGRVESEVATGVIQLSFYLHDNKVRAVAYFDPGMDGLLVKTQLGTVEGQVFQLALDETTDWRKVGGVWFPIRYSQVSYMGPNKTPIKDYDLQFKNVRVNEAAQVRDSDLTLDALELPDGLQGIDRRSNPPRWLVRRKGRVREQRPGDATEKMSPEFKKAMEEEQRRAQSLAETEAQQVLTRRWRWTVATYACAAASVLIAAFLGRRLYVRLRA